VFQPSEYVRTSEDRFHGMAELWWVTSHDILRPWQQRVPG
jgi:hypothetical protein